MLFDFFGCSDDEEGEDEKHGNHGHYQAAHGSGGE